MYLDKTLERLQFQETAAPFLFKALLQHFHLAPQGATCSLSNWRAQDPVNTQLLPRGNHCTSNWRCLRMSMIIKSWSDLWGQARFSRSRGGQDCRVIQEQAKSLELDPPESEPQLLHILAMWHWSSHSTFWSPSFQKCKTETVKPTLLG